MKKTRNKELRLRNLWVSTGEAKETGTVGYIGRKPMILNIAPLRSASLKLAPQLQFAPATFGFIVSYTIQGSVLRFRVWILFNTDDPPLG